MTTTIKLHLPLPADSIDRAIMQLAAVRTPVATICSMCSITEVELNARLVKLWAVAND